MSKQCQNCRQQNPPDAAFCLNCASPLNQAQVSSQQTNQQANQQNQQPNQQWNQPNFGAQQAGQNFAPPTQPANAGAASQRATTALILAISGIFCCGPLTSIPAIIVGWMEVSAIKQGQSPQAGMKFAQIGIWGGVAGIILQIVGFIFWIIISMAAATSDPYYY